MKDKVRIGLFGIELESVNFGVSALAYTQMKMLEEIEKRISAEVEYWIFSDDSNEGIELIKQTMGVKNLERKYLVRIKTGIPGIKRLWQDIKSCDFIIDLTYGDSFSDIYGFKNFILYSMPKLVAVWSKKCLVLGPQTYGPFYKKNVKIIGKYILKKAEYIVARDELSLDYVQKLTGRQDILLTSDLAMELPYDKSMYQVDNAEQMKVGLNVSLLLWEKNVDNSNIGVKLNYQVMIRNLITNLMTKGMKVHLIVHEYTENKYTEYMLAEKLHQEFTGTVLAPRFKTPMEAKNYMANLDVFIGSRMHATIGAFSAGVPVIPVSYSRKFEGLYSSIGYEHCIDCSKENQESAEEKILEKIQKLEHLKQDLEEAFEETKKRNNRYKELLENIISESM